MKFFLKAQSVTPGPHDASEVFEAMGNRPIIVGRVPRECSEKERAQFLTEIAALANGSTVVVLPEGYTLEVLTIEPAPAS